MAKANDKTGKIITYVIVILLVLYILYLFMKAKGNELSSGCFVMEETHPAPNGDDWVCMHPDSRPASGTRPFTTGGTFEIKNTNSELNGEYTILDTWIDTSDRQGCLLTQHSYTYDFGTAQQGGTDKDVTFYGIGEICPV